MANQNLFFIIDGLGKMFQLHNLILVMSHKFLGVLSNLGKYLPSYFLIKDLFCSTAINLHPKSTEV